MADVVYTSKVHIERIKGPLRVATLPGESQPVVFSVHGAIAEHYKIDPSTIAEPHAATLDYAVAVHRSSAPTARRAASTYARSSATCPASRASTAT